MWIEYGICIVITNYRKKEKLQTKTLHGYIMTLWGETNNYFKQNVGVIKAEIRNLIHIARINFDQKSILCSNIFTNPLLWTAISAGSFFFLSVFLFLGGLFVFF